MDLQQKIQELAQQAIDDPSIFILEVKVGTALGIPKLKVVLDGDKGITIEQCTTVSRRITKAIETQELLEQYGIEVTSPGADQPLKQWRQYPQHVGRSLEITLQDGTSLEGELKQAEAEQLLIAKKPKKKKDPVEEVTVAFPSIKSAKVIVSF
jgi:ribosome maturation factor RimP